MAEFFPIRDGRVLIRSAGVYKHAELFKYNDFIFAKYGSGYIRLHASGTTSKTKVTWSDIELEVPYSFHMGYMKVT